MTQSGELPETDLPLGKKTALGVTREALRRTANSKFKNSEILNLLVFFYTSIDELLKVFCLSSLTIFILLTSSFLAL